MSPFDISTPWSFAVSSPPSAGRLKPGRFQMPDSSEPSLGSANISGSMSSLRTYAESSSFRCDSPVSEAPAASIARSIGVWPSAFFWRSSAFSFAGCL